MLNFITKLNKPQPKFKHPVHEFIIDSKFTRWFTTKVMGKYFFKAKSDLLWWGITITLPFVNYIFYLRGVGDDLSDFLRIHEHQHVIQRYRYKFVFMFWYVYLLEHFKKGYRANKFEKEAVQVENEFWFSHTLPSWLTEK